MQASPLPRVAQLVTEEESKLAGANSHHFVQNEAARLDEPETMKELMADRLTFAGSQPVAYDEHLNGCEMLLRESTTEERQRIEEEKMIERFNQELLHA